MNMAKIQNLRAAAITFMVYLLLPVLILTLLTLIIWISNLLSGHFGLLEILGLLPGIMTYMFRLIGNTLAISGALFAVYFGLRVLAKPCFDRVEAALVASAVPLISIVAVDLCHFPTMTLPTSIMSLASVETVVGLLASLASVLFCRHVLVRAGVLCKQETIS